MPVAPPAPPPAQTAPPPKPIVPDVDLYDAAGEIDDLDSGTPPGDPPPGDVPPKPGEKAKPVDPKSADTDETDAEIDALDVIENPEANPKPKTKLKEGDDAPEPPGDKEKEGEAPGDKDGEQLPTRARDLKVVYEKVKAEKKGLETKLEEATKEIAKLRSTGPEESSILTEKLTKSEARRNELEQEIRHLNYTKSEEYQTKFDKPNRDAWARAAADLAQLQVETEDGVRSAEIKDLTMLANLPLGEAIKLSRTMFGDAAPVVMDHIRVVRDLAEKQQAAIEESRKSAAEHEKTKALESRKQQEKFTQLWMAENNKLAKRYPKWFAPVPEDPEGNTILERGFAEVDRAFNDPDMAPEERLAAHVRVRNKAANHDRLALRLKRAVLKIKKYREELEAYKKSTPVGGKTAARAAKGGSMSVVDEISAEIDAMDDGQ